MSSARVLERYQKVNENEKKEWEKRIRAQFQLQWGGPLCAVAEHDPELAQRLAQAIVSCMSDLLPTQKKEGKKRTQNALGPADGKSAVVLERERKVMGVLLESDKPVKFAQLLAAVRGEVEPSLGAAVLTAHLNRLEKVGVIERPSKGRYKASSQTAGYLKMVESELAKRF